MASDALTALHDQGVLEAVARLAVAELGLDEAPTDPGQAHGTAQGQGRAAGRGPRPDLEVKSASGVAQVSRLDLSRAVAVALRTVLDGDDVLSCEAQGSDATRSCANSWRDCHPSWRRSAGL